MTDDKGQYRAARPRPQRYSGLSLRTGWKQNGPAMRGRSAFKLPVQGRTRDGSIGPGQRVALRPPD
ncbi:hypothetical protein [Pseudoxanthomonas sp. PXM02]|uniref:hypothetical protein n=1 Tax=Pseudoxanthomonas sp. PXM02 TaxID=2769294 RepID=UPI001784FDCA|nr:hypothetical protein [Pseudoxanthomonas sp. PXM02]MBD9478389.1 hypothetical protein [Pseudoxanthomonas sp. PXM02]